MKTKKIFKKFKKSIFIGKQLSRLKMGMSYYSLMMTTINAAMLIKLVYDDIKLRYIIILIPFLILGTIFMGWFLDKYNINTLDTWKSNERAHRFLLKSDTKSQEFQLLQTKLLISAIESMKNNENFDNSKIQTEYKKYIKKWESPYE